jgi:hypothetical protein
MNKVKTNSGCSLRTLITARFSAQSIVYERLFDNYIPQQQRESYFLTEVYNINSMLRHQSSATEEGMDLKLRTAILKGINQNCQSLLPYYNKLNSGDKTLIFESRFESGNLSMAVKVKISCFNIIGIG